MSAKRIHTLGLAVFACLLAPVADSHNDPHWTYDEQKKWGVLVDPTYNPKFPYAECAIGQKQSPVNIDSTDVHKTDDIDEMNIDYAANPLSVTNNGHTLRVNVSSGNLHIGRNLYSLAQYHFHAPSEHHLDGTGYPLEIHFVHGTEDGRLAVIAVFMQTGEFNPEFQKILDAAPQKAGATTTDDATLSDPNLLLPKNRKNFYTYAGSLTTPPCNEGVQWYVMTETVQASAEQIEWFINTYYRNNARGEQRLNGRHLLMH